MVRRIVDIGSVLGVSLSLLWTASAAAATPSTQPTDPNANSPAGVMYAIPLDAARQDAAPHGHAAASGGSGSTTGGGSGGGGSGASGSSAGGARGATSSQSSGHTGADGGSGALGSASSGSKAANASGGSRSGSGGGEPVLVPGGQPGSLIHSSNGFGSSPVVPGTAGSTASDGLAAVQSDSGSAPLMAILLAAVVMAIGAYAGARAWRGPRRPPASSA